MSSVDIPSPNPQNHSLFRFGSLVTSRVSVLLAINSWSDACHFGRPPSLSLMTSFPQKSLINKIKHKYSLIRFYTNIRNFNTLKIVCFVVCYTLSNGSVRRIPVPTCVCVGPPLRCVSPLRSLSLTLDYQINWIATLIMWSLINWLLREEKKQCFD